MQSSVSACQKVCPVCVTPSGSYFVPVGEFKIYKCAHCGLEHTYPIPSKVQLKNFYASYDDVRAAPDVVRLNARRNLKLLERFGYDGTKTVLDFGTGDAAFVGVAGPNCFGIDFKVSANPRVYTDLEDLPVKQYDFVTLWGVLEHLDHPVQVLSALHALLKPGGIMVLTTVNAEGSIPYYYKPVEHLTYWTKNSFVHLFEKVGIELLSIEPYRMKQRPEIYADRLLSRTPVAYRHAFSNAVESLPKYIEVPTNEVLVVAIRQA